MVEALSVAHWCRVGDFLWKGKLLYQEAQNWQKRQWACDVNLDAFRENQKLLRMSAVQ